MSDGFLGSPLTCDYAGSKIAKSAVSPQKEGRAVVSGRASRRAAREALVVTGFGADRSAAALDLLELVELAWHDCFGEITPPDEVIDDILVVAGGDLASLVRAGRLAVEDWRDLRVAADRARQDRT